MVHCDGGLYNTNCDGGAVLYEGGAVLCDDGVVLYEGGAVLRLTNRDDVVLRLTNRAVYELFCAHDDGAVLRLTNRAVGA